MLLTTVAIMLVVFVQFIILDCKASMLHGRSKAFVVVVENLSRILYTVEIGFA